VRRSTTKREERRDEMALRNEEIGRRLIAAKAFDFKAIGNLVAELAPELAVSGIGHRIILIGRPVITACILQAGEFGERVGVLGNLGVSEALKE
jgi:hypothetical protein